MKAATTPIKAAHITRKADPAPRKASKALPEVTYPPGHFTAPCRAWWGEHWQPHPDTPPTRSPAQIAHLAIATAIARRDGTGWGQGTCPMPGTPANNRPGWMGA